MSIESEIQAEIESLKERFGDTKDLYREVCALLFFRYGITPTASKLYQYVRKGSMSAPAEALAKFWDDLRSKARVQIDHPNLPDALKVAAADAVQTIWGQATELAREELASLRLEAKADASKALADLEALQSRARSLEAQIREGHERLAALAGQHQACQEELEKERRSHSATAARATALQSQVTEMHAQQERIRADFSGELEKGRATIAAANERAAGAERRALREIDQERTARTATEKQLEGVRNKLAEADRQNQARALEHATLISRINAELDAANGALKNMTAAFDGQGLQLSAAQQQASQFKAEADTLRALVAQFKVSPTAKVGRSKRGTS